MLIAWWKQTKISVSLKQDSPDIVTNDKNMQNMAGVEIKADSKPQKCSLRWSQMAILLQNFLNSTCEALSLEWIRTSKQQITGSRESLGQ